MLTKRKKRVFIIISILMGVSSSVGFILYALRQNVDLYYTPTQLLARPDSPVLEIRLGGLVVKGSVNKIPDTLKIDFIVTDGKKNIKVHYEGILPALFHEGQGIIAQGKLNKNNIFIAEQVLAKHDENYKPPQIQ